VIVNMHGGTTIKKASCCSNFFILQSYRCLTQPCKTKHLPQSDDSISVERENRAGYRNVLDNSLTNEITLTT
jgi:hypothetical protein